MKLTDEEKENLAGNNWRYIHYFAKKYHSSQWDYEELVSAGTLGMTQALNTFDTEKEIKFSTYSARCITNAIFMYMRREKKHLGNISIEQPISTDERGNDLTIIDLLSVEEKEFDWREISSTVNKVLNKYPNRTRKILTLFFENKNQREIGKLLDLSQSYISRIIKAALTEIKKEYWRGEPQMAVITVEEYKKLKEEGLTDTQIAIKKNTSPSYLSALKKKWDKVQERPVEMDEQVPETHTVAVDKTAEYESQIKRLREICEEKSSAVFSLQETLKEYQSDGEKYETEILELNRKVSDLESLHATCDDVESEVEILRKENDALREENFALKFFARRYLAV
ncbi:sigma-70 family RNA polymerase sigma factor [Neobacillus sp. MM2021_6]|uniref:sigma-70 family RNA polymerase sigma factor n=1 Tax=Bacillaceae TaxID=186817 RepID=UPI00140D4067|nr:MULTISPECIES: sigma-70 family RNA polymerase sigma factor [Bacillaceae]MBO0961991.1 sigma-70 family RNA polymerase sigma factor [Neobacillus sp. MM2021_6]NHC20313.1 sigma-70 family RNA polymerase sigma factor [Bacillus sp. MM2020_4]